MKIKFLALAALFACSTTFANAQENYYTKKATDNIFLGFGVGGMSVFNGGLNSPTFNFNIQLGKYITPTWGVRAEISGLWQSLEGQDKSWFVSGTNKYSDYCKMFGELNADAMLNVTNWLGGYNPDRVVDFYLFAGPTMNLASKGTQFTGQTTANEEALLEEADGAKLRIGATAGLGLGFNVSDKWAINVEGRFGVTPSIFGDASACRKAEATGRLTIGATYTFGGKNFAKVSDRVVEKEVVKEVVKEVPVEVVKEVVKEIGGGSAAIFFKIGKAKISPEGMVNIKLMAQAMKKYPNAKYKVAGFADKGTGSVSFNQTLSEKRAQAVYDALVAEGVNPNQLEKVAMGGTDPMFEKAYLNRVVIMEVK
ncbi:MAG: OmpA family protein [Bacteroidaceae bacterium]|nr:OmpA family protein [Bacteroidaceae bacterium]